jgi:phosphoserine aminotransferase
LARAYHFASDPAMLPEPVLNTTQHEVPGWHGRGYWIIETSRRGRELVAVMAERGQLLRRLLGPHHG